MPIGITHMYTAPLQHSDYTYISPTQPLRQTAPHHEGRLVEHPYQAALERRRYGHALGRGSLNVNATHHFILSTARSILCIALGTKCFGYWGPTRFTNECFPGARGCLNNRRHTCSVERIALHQSTETVPKRTLRKIPQYWGYGLNRAKCL